MRLRGTRTHRFGPSATRGCPLDGLDLRAGAYLGAERISVRMRLSSLTRRERTCVHSKSFVDTRAPGGRVSGGIFPRQTGAWVVGAKWQAWPVGRVMPGPMTRSSPTAVTWMPRSRRRSSTGCSVSPSRGTRRALRVFRDASSLSANPALWPAIEGALANTRYFVLLASPASAASPWVGREVPVVLANRPLDRMIIALTAGQLPWDARAPVPPHEQAITGYLAARFGTEAPRWVDLRALHHESQVSTGTTRSFRTPSPTSARRWAGVPKDLLVGEHIREHRRTLRLAAVGLVCARDSGGGFDRGVRGRALPSATPRADKPVSRPHASSPRLPRRASGQISSRAMLLAAAGYRMAPSAQTLQAVYATGFCEPEADPFPLHAGHDHCGGGDAGRAHYRHRRTRGRDHPLRSGERCVDPHRDDDHVDRLAASTDAAVLVATNGRQVALFGRSSGSLPVVRGRSILSVAVSPDGSTVVIGGSVDATLKGFVDIVDTSTQGRPVTACHVPRSIPAACTFTSTSVSAISGSAISVKCQRSTGP